MSLSWFYNASMVYVIMHWCNTMLRLFGLYGFQVNSGRLTKDRLFFFFAQKAQPPFEKGFCVSMAFCLKKARKNRDRMTESW